MELPTPNPALAQLGVVPPRGPHWKNEFSYVGFSHPFVHTHASRDQSLEEKIEPCEKNAADAFIREGTPVVLPSNHTAAWPLSVVAVGQVRELLENPVKSPLLYDTGPAETRLSQTGYGANVKDESKSEACSSTSRLPATATNGVEEGVAVIELVAAAVAERVAGGDRVTDPLGVADGVCVATADAERVAELEGVSLREVDTEATDVCDTVSAAVPDADGNTDEDTDGSTPRVSEGVGVGVLGGVTLLLAVEEGVADCELAAEAVGVADSEGVADTELVGVSVTGGVTDAAEVPVAEADEEPDVVAVRDAVTDADGVRDGVGHSGWFHTPGVVGIVVRNECVSSHENANTNERSRPESGMADDCREPVVVAVQHVPAEP